MASAQQQASPGASHFPGLNIEEAHNVVAATATAATVVPADLRINDLLFAAAWAVKAMFKLEVLEMWSSDKGQAGIFRYVSGAPDESASSENLSQGQWERGLRPGACSRVTPHLCKGRVSSRCRAAFCLRLPDSSYYQEAAEKRNT